jgi:hypothetical protein
MVFGLVFALGDGVGGLRRRAWRRTLSRRGRGSRGRGRGSSVGKGRGRGAGGGRCMLGGRGLIGGLTSEGQ